MKLKIFVGIYLNERNSMIPKIIHYCWLSKDPYPAGIQACLYSWKKYLPDYEFKLWNFSSFDIESSQWVKTAFFAGKYAFAADYIRAYALYHYGGIYLDCDVEVLKSYDDLLHLPYFIGKEKTNTPIEAATMGFEKGHPLMKLLLDYYKGRTFYLGNKEKKGKSSFDIRPLPAIMLDLINTHFSFHEIECIDEFDFSSNVINVLPADYFSPKQWDTQELNVTSRTYSIHHFSGSWLKGNFGKKLAFYWYRFLGLVWNKYHIE